MFNSKLKQAVKRLEQTLDRDRESVATKYWELRHNHERLLSALGLVEQVTQHRIDYVKKDGPERSDE